MYTGCFCRDSHGHQGMMKLFTTLFLSLFVLINAASAQQNDDVVWIQVEALPSLTSAQTRARDYSARLEDVSGFALGGGWYGIVLGPYTRRDADQVMQVYKSGRRIPADSYITFTSRLGQQFWPVGTDVLNRQAESAPVQTEQPAQEQVVQEQAQPEPQPSDETPAQARRSEQALSRDERKQLQIALRAAGFYNSAIDGAFGRGTRGSMAQWQTFNGFEDTGVLTTKQRKVLMDQYNAPLISVGMKRIEDTKAGIAIQMPTKAVALSRYESPFANYPATGDIKAQVLLISQPGSQAALFGLYDILQTLEIVPTDGPRKRTKTSFTIEGRGQGIVSYTQASLKNGEIKGFTLVWPEGDDARQARVLAEMQNSFERLPGVLDPAEGADAPQNIDLVSGLKIRKPRHSASGFFVDSRGSVVTSAETVNACGRITLDHEYDAEIAATDAVHGIAVLKPRQALAPVNTAALLSGKAQLQSDIVASGYSYGGVLGAATLSFGSLADVKGLNGETTLSRLALATLPGDAGGPVLDLSGGVWGMLLPAPAKGRQLPQDVSFAADADAIRSVLDKAGIAASGTTTGEKLPPDDLTRRATGMTVLVSCWD